jgi:hypothetical protein
VSPFEGDYLQETIDVAKQMAEYEKAVDSIMNVIMKRCYAGDFVSHDRMSTPVDQRTVNITGPAAERIAFFLGFSETNRSKPEKHMFDQSKHPGHYYYECEGDFTFRGRTVHAIGNASTRNPFYSREYGKDKNPSNIPEEYIMREAWRDCAKQGIKGWFGLRRIPIMKLKELGYDIAHVKYVNYKETEQSQSVTNREATRAPQETDRPTAQTEEMIIRIESMSAKMSKGGKPFYAIVDEEGVNCYAWGDDKSEKVSKLLVAWRDKKPVKVAVKGGQFPTIESVLQ